MDLDWRTRSTLSRGLVERKKTQHVLKHEERLSRKTIKTVATFGIRLVRLARRIVDASEPLAHHVIAAPVLSKETA